MYFEVNNVCWLTGRSGDNGSKLSRTLTVSKLSVASSTKLEPKTVNESQWVLIALAITMVLVVIELLIPCLFISRRGEAESLRPTYKLS